ncbi:MAG TPA: hypothetical protein VJN18_19160 [Polyangiaceae bacterium]|nr:hypothetical protein [Polyangiaceae bacterium]
MSEKNPTLQDVWHSLQDMWSLLGTMNKRFDGFERRLDGVERQMVLLREDLGGRIHALDSRMTVGFGALKESIEARDFRLDEHGRRLSELERSRT